MTTISTPTALAADTASGTQRAAAAPGRLGVPWSTVVPLAVAMAYADGFWMTSLRGAFGAVGRTEQPFTSWWHESTLAVPIFGLAVLAAVTLALRWFGPTAGKPKTVLATGLLIGAAGTLVGVAAIAASSVYDYHLETAQLRFMSSLHGVCTGNCLAEQVHATLAVQIHAVVFAARALLITNLVLVAWIVAMRGGRIKLGIASRRRASDQPARSRTDDLRLLLAAGLLASAAIQIAAPDHLSRSSAAGLALLGLAGAQIITAATLLARPRRGALHAAVLITVAPLVVWLATRTIGLPLGPTAGVHRGSVTVPGCTAAVLQAAALLVALVLLRASNRSLHRPRLSPHLTALALLIVTSATLLALTPIASSWLANTPTPAGHTLHDHAAHDHAALTSQH